MYARFSFLGASVIGRHQPLLRAGLNGSYIREKRVRFVLAHTEYFAAISYFFWKTGFQENERKRDEGMHRRRNDIARITEETGSGP